MSKAISRKTKDQEPEIVYLNQDNKESVVQKEDQNSEEEKSLRKLINPLWILLILEFINKNH